MDCDHDSQFFDGYWRCLKCGKYTDEQKTKEKMQPENSNGRMPQQPIGPDPKQQQAMQMMARMATQMREQMEAESLVKPNEQEINNIKIVWTWYLPEGRLLKASIDKPTKKFEVEFIANPDKHKFTVDEAKIIGDSMSSAARWEKLWKQHAGEYLIDDEEPEILLQPQRHENGQQSEDN